jgi:hypothetical protein
LEAHLLSRRSIDQPIEQSNDQSSSFNDWPTSVIGKSNTQSTNQFGSHLLSDAYVRSSRLNAQSIDQSINQPINQPFNQLIDDTEQFEMSGIDDLLDDDDHFNQAINQSVNQSIHGFNQFNSMDIDRGFNQSNNHSLDQATNRLNNQ